MLQSGVLAFVGNLLTSAEELKNLQLMFMKMDKDKNGFLSIEELKAGMMENIGSVFLTNDYYE